MGSSLAVALLLFVSQAALDSDSTDVCERVPGAEVARLFSKELKEARPFLAKGEFSRCTYLVTNPGSSETVAGYSLWLYSSPDDYDELLPYTEGIVERPEGLGDEAVLFVDPGDGRAKLRLVVRKRFSVEATAGDPESVKKLAKLALDRLTR
jgi:hypothetical protein